MTPSATASNAPPLAAAPGTLAKPARTAWVDIMRGYAMLLIVLGHTLIGLLNAKLLPNNEASRFSIYFIYLFHVPLIFFVSGLVSKDQTKSWPVFLKYQFLWLVVPYFVWSFLTIAMQKLSPGAVNVPIHFSAMLTLPWKPITIYWFLWVLFWIKVIDRVVYLAWKNEGAGIALLMAVSGALCIASYAVADVNDLIHKLLASLFFYELGRLLSRHTGKLNATVAFFRHNVLLWIAVPVAIAAILIGFGVLYLYAPPATLVAIHDLQRYILLTGTLGIAAMVLVSCASEKVALLSTVRWLGVYSMVIYVQHTLWGAAIRTVLLKLHIHAPIVYVVVLAGGGIVLSILWQMVADRIGISQFFGIRPMGKRVVRPQTAA